MLHDAAPLVPFGWDDRVATLFTSLLTSLDDPALEPGRVVRVERSACVIRLVSGEMLAFASPLPAVGDWVAVALDGDSSSDTTDPTDPTGAPASSAVVRTVLHRRSSLIRRDPSGTGDQVLAANVDLVVVVAPLDRLHLSRVERELLLAWEGGATPVVVLTKADISDDAAALAEETRTRLVGTDIIVTSAVSGEGVDEVAALLQPNRTAVLFGPSGAGKSTLANALIGDEVQATGEVRDGDKRGRHTTTSRQLVVIPGGGVLIDTPGLRSLAIATSEGGLAATFPDIEELLGECRFRDCQHESEPGCAVTAAVASGRLDAARLASYKKLLRELEFAEQANDVRFQQERNAKWKAIHKAARHFPPKR